MKKKTDIKKIHIKSNGSFFMKSKDIFDDKEKSLKLIKKLQKSVDHYIGKTNKYKCKHCKKIVERDSDKQWIKSYCDVTGKNVHLILIKKK